eukprot:TRINITY_DN13496_c0_g1_i2.p1 TRINITY_DN13496_c0_g1~~TRINITY_DN13496_c0_g1_i2.p1  ORF type:complete len:369 (-),score=34.52 TRINITY_DN13496_c0_g1_i2:101-1207(-)
MAAWDTKDVSTWVARCLKLPYAKLFEQAEVDGSKLVQLHAEDLRQLGISNPQHIQQLESYIEIFRSLLGAQDGAPGGSMPPVPASIPVPRKRNVSPGGPPAKDPASAKVAPTPRPLTSRNGNVRAPSRDMREHRASLGARPTSKAGAGASSLLRTSESARAIPNASASTPAVAPQRRGGPGTGEQETTGGGSAGGDGDAQEESLALWTGSGGPALHPILHSAMSCESLSLTQHSGKMSRSPSRLEAVNRQVNDTTFRPHKQGSFTRATTGRSAPREMSPGHYCGNETVAAPGAASFGRAPRYTDRCLLTKGQEGPGVGRYSPPPRRPMAKGGTFDREKRFKDPGERSPGPLTYRPLATALSTFGRGKA